MCKIFTSPALFVLPLFLTGCLSVDEFYTAVPTGDIALIDHEGDLNADPVQGMSLDDLILNREAEDYALVGHADFNAPSHQDWTGAMVRKGRDIKAAKIDYYTWYDRTDSGTGFLSMPTTQTSTGTIWGPTGLRTVTMTTTGSTIMPYNYNITRNEYRVFYFKKRLHPLRMGLTMAIPNDELAKKFGTRRAVHVTSVVPGKLAWKNDLFTDDVILDIGGKSPTFEDVRLIAPGTKLKIWRDGKIIEKVFEEK